MDFLNKKSWHPGSYKNRKKVFLAEEKARESEKKREALLEEYKAERTTADDVAGRHNEEKPVMFLYSAPPGYVPGVQGAASESVVPRVDDSGARVKGHSGKSESGFPRKSHVSHVIDGIRLSQHPNISDISGTCPFPEKVDVEWDDTRRCTEESLNSGRGFVVNQFRDEDEEQQAYELAMIPDALQRSKRYKRQQHKRKKKLEMMRKKESKKKLKEARKILSHAGLL